MQKCADCCIVINLECDQPHKVFLVGEEQTVCDACYDNYRQCEYCHTDVHEHETHQVTSNNIHYDTVCENCYDCERPHLFDEVYGWEWAV